MRSRLLTEIALVVIAFLVLGVIGRPLWALLLILGYLGWKLRYIIKYCAMRYRVKNPRGLL